jgi:hypothetical protein
LALSSQSLNMTIFSRSGSASNAASSAPLNGPPWNSSDFFDAADSES